MHTLQHVSYTIQDLTYVKTYYPRSVPLGEFQNNQGKKFS